MATAACDTFFDLPELVCRLTHFLPQHDLIKLLQLNHHINTICTPELWRTLDLTPRIVSEQLLDSPLGLQALSRNINSLNRSTLTHLSLNRVPLTPLRILRHICRTLSQLTHLQTLRLEAPWGHFINHQSFNALFSSCPRSLVEFSLRAEVEYFGGGTDLTPDEDDWDFDQRPLVPSTEPFHCLMRLEFPRIRSKESAQAVIIVPTLMLCPALETLKLPAIKDAQTIELISMTLRLFCPLVTDMSLASDASVREGGEDVMGIMQQISPGHRLRNIYLINCLDNALPSTTAAAFLQHAVSLRRVELSATRLLKSATIQTILVSCQGLEYLKIEENVSSTDCALHLEDAALAEWGCARIRYLELTVAFTPDGRDPKYFAADPTMTTWTEEDHHHWDLMDRLYTQIGALSELVVLKLKAAGVPRPPHTPRNRQRGDNFKDTCLPGLLSLEDPTSGKIGFLSRLSGLTKLRELRGSLFWTNREVLARTGEREVEWRRPGLLLEGDQRDEGDTIFL
ncbi:hypothetical protein KI688_004179 [Linnemannia hyalina]|uniref:F-box domain-containing protein n=1 Tax=Linnemannia hyalina TaxID=64524 RepID=A0A9P8BRV2_9FUNG|nr:hypothetical protein KI688_004179 [Linnemannia hyalina]